MWGAILVRPRGQQNLQELLQDLVDRVRALETRRTYNLGGWVLKETPDGRVVALNRTHNLEVELAALDDADEV